jgi:hypothetical protein
VSLSITEGTALAGLAQDTDDDIHVVVEGDDSGVRTEPDGTVVIDQPGGGVVVQLHPQAEPDKDIDDPAKFYENIADKIGDGRLMVIANELFEAIEADDSSRSEWLSDRAQRMGLLGLKSEDPSSGDGSSAVDGQSVVTNPLLLDAMLRGWANAQAELLPAEGPCKIADYNPIPGQQNDELAEAFQRDMNYFLTTTATEFAPETSHMLLWGTYFGGSGFKKVYTHPLKKRPSSEAVSPENLIVSDATKDLASCERITHVIPMRQSVMKRYQMKGIYRKVTLTPPTATPDVVAEEIASTQGVAVTKQRPEDQPYTLWEVQCELDLPEFSPAEYRDAGVPLPYLVTIDKDSREILAVRRDWKPEDEECARKQMYVKYPYVPGPGFYGTGLAGILGNSTAAMTAAWRISLDTGMFASFPAFIMDKLAGRQNTSDFRLSPGTGTGVETGGRPLSEVVMALPYKDVLPGLMGLVDKITQQAKEVGGAPDIPVGEGMQNIPVGTMLAHIEQATKVMAAAHKGQHRAMDEELGLIADLFRENPESFWKGNKAAKGIWTVEKLLQALDTHSLVPKSDPNVPSHIHRLMKAVALVELVTGPLGALLDKGEVLRRTLSAMREDPIGLILPPQPQAPPSPEEITANAKMLDAKTKAEKLEKVDAPEQQNKMQLASQEADATIKGKTIDLARTLVTHSGEREDAQHGRGMDLAKHALDQKTAAVDATKTVSDAMVDHGKLALEHRKVGLAENQHATETAQAGAEHQHQVGVDTSKLGLEGAKVGISQQAADTATHTALNPPEKAKPKKKK